jgi:hypothetical protein
MKTVFLTWLLTNVPSDNDESNDGYVSAMEIGKNPSISDRLEHHFNFSYPRYNPLLFQA